MAQAQISGNSRESSDSDIELSSESEDDQHSVETINERLQKEQQKWKRIGKG